MHAENYRRVKELRAGGDLEHLARAIRLAKDQARQRLLLRWNIYLEGATGRSEMRVAEAIRPFLKEWVDRARGELSFCTTQILIGHGCFGEYLHRIGKEFTSRCHHCGDEVDSAQHTLGECSSWVAERRVLIDVVGADLSPPALIRTMLRGDMGWSAVTFSCDTVMTQKEEAERERRGEIAPQDGVRRRSRRAAPHLSAH
ncbi:uncharacterized protein LOC116851601 [Odontomachus brunneus]|uniref:uncharacterized protein LOC116851601 n=1 Tax=Odontomachus brunneus TaxID=486640 RepID=UPI0013F23054|nr:uncharacterized protein LOC116851601 [Odontomachus brunneus]